MVSIWVGPLAWSHMSTLPRARIEHALKIQRQHHGYINLLLSQLFFFFPPCYLEMKMILEKFKETEQWIEKSVLIGCSDEHVPRFAVDLG